MKYLLIFLLILIFGCNKMDVDDVPNPKSIVLSSVKTKGVILEKINRMCNHHALILQTPNDIIQISVSEVKYEFLNVGDTIK